jgi:hypothetical protein
MENTPKQPPSRAQATGSPATSNRQHPLARGTSEVGPPPDKQPVAGIETDPRDAAQRCLVGYEADGHL